MPPSSKKQLGDRGEALVSAWLQQAGWLIVAQQWHCRWGELDIVAHRSSTQPCLAFVEVKTRQRSSLDAGGRLAITYPKQRKLWRSAEQFLSQYPQYGELPCRFDVALVAQNVD
ncbi:MAG: YraN family protein, partial [Leptolyngbya sp. SIO1D8]|nr:YraN family protein [Leptolyngbya sp. SIO1D8]